MCNSRSNILQTDAMVITNSEVMPGVYLLWLNCPTIAATVRAGQFVMVSCGGEHLLRRPISIHRVCADRLNIALLYAVVGGGTQWLARSKSGQFINLLGPLGNSFSIDEKGDNLLLIGGGMGIAPLAFLADEACRMGKNATLLVGSRSKDMLCPIHLINDKVDYRTVTEDGSCGSKGFVTHRLAEFAPQADQVFTCGPAPMYRALASEPLLRDKEVQVSLETRMACGFGSCYGCTVKTKKGLKQVCYHGPVFDIKDILWDELREV